jgi:hypothetical protein
MEKVRIWILSALILLFLAENLWAKVPVCDEAPSFAEAKHLDGLDPAKLPERIFVARSVDVWAENKPRGLKLFARHNFKNMKSEVRCSRAPYEGSVNLNSWIPALLDLSREKKWGDSLWQLQALSEAKRVGIWSQKSRLAPLEEGRKIMSKGTWRFIDADTYELIWEQVQNGTRLSYRVVFDVMNP